MASTTNVAVESVTVTVTMGENTSDTASKLVKKPVLTSLPESGKDTFIPE